MEWQPARLLPPSQWHSSVVKIHKDLEWLKVAKSMAGKVVSVSPSDGPRGECGCLELYVSPESTKNVRPDKLYDLSRVWECQVSTD